MSAVLLLKSLLVPFLICAITMAGRRWGPGMIYGYFAFATFCLVLSLQLREGAVAVAFAAAFCCALAVQLAVRRLVAPAAQPKPAAVR